jgi:glycosyltransferase involved in cell wall biosynthesis
VIVVVDEMATRLQQATGLSRESFVVVENTEDPAVFLDTAIEPVPELSDQLERFVLMHVGSMPGRQRGLETVVAAMPAILSSEPNALLVFVGDGRIRPRLEAAARETGVDGSVRFLGHQPSKRVPSFIAAADICLVPHAAQPQTEAALPHKLFQYMLMRKPTVVSSCRPLKRISDETNACVVFEAGDPSAFAAAVLALRDPALRTRLGDSGWIAATTTHCWRVSAERLVQMYDSLLVAPRPSPVPARRIGG